MSSPTPPCRRETLPKPRLAALLLFVVSILALSGGNIRAAFAAPNETGGPYRPAATVSASSTCYNTEHTFQQPGGFAAWCDGAGNVVYRVPTLQLPADATNVRYRVSFEGYALAAPAQVTVGVSPISNSFPVVSYLSLGTSKINTYTPFQGWEGDWTALNNGQVYVKIARTQGTVYWDNLQLVVLYDTPLKADLAVGIDGESTVLSGSTFEWTINVTNNGPQDVSNIVLTATLADGLALPSITGCSNSPGYPSCNIGHIVSGGNRTLKLTALANTGASGPRTISLSVTGGLADPKPANNSISRSITVIPSRNVTLCTEWEDNGDGATEAAKAFGYIVHHTTPGTDPVILSRSVSEGNTICGTFKTRGETLNILSTSYDGLFLAAGYPKWEKFVSGTSGTGTANLAIADWKVTFVVKGKPQAQPTATPTNTPRPSTPTPAPTNTPTPKPTNTPTPQPTNAPAPTSTPVVPTPAPTQPSQGDAPQPAPANPQDSGHPQQPGGPTNGGGTGTGAGGNGSNAGETGSNVGNTPDADNSPGAPTDESAAPSDHPTSDAGGAVSSGPVVTDPTESAPASAAAPVEDGGSNLVLFGLAGAVAMVLIGLGIVALGRRKSEPSQ